MRTLFVAFLYASAALLLCAQTAHAWWCLGHMATAQVAKSQMTPATIAYVESVIAAFSDMGPFYDSGDMVEVACWADDVKGRFRLPMMADWHFTNLVYNPDNVPLPEGDHVQNENVAKVIKQLYQGIQANKQNPSGWAMGFAVANLIHFIGDIHQPLHAVELFSEEFPNGDRGGNSETVYVDGQKTNLHAVWDSICWSWTEDLYRPLDMPSRMKLEDFSSYLVENYNFSEKQIGTYDPAIMAQESFDACGTHVYPGVVTGKELPKHYLSQCQRFAEARVALGGLRLGRQLQTLLGQFAATWHANQQMEEDEQGDNDDDENGVVVAAPPPSREDEQRLFNKTAAHLKYLDEGLKQTIQLRAEKLKVAHLGREKM